MLMSLFIQYSAESKSDNWLAWYGWCMRGSIEEHALKKDLIHSSDFHTACSCEANMLDANPALDLDLVSNQCIDTTFTKRLRYIDYATWRTMYFW